LRENLPAHFKHGLEAFPSLDGVLAESRDCKVLNTVLDFLPAAAERDNAGVLVKDGAAVGAGSVDDDLVHADEVVEGHILAAHGDLLGREVDVRCLVDVTDILAAAEDRGEPLGRALFAGYQAFGTKLVDVSIESTVNKKGSGCCTYNSSLGVDSSVQRVDCYYVWALVVPWAVFAPIRRRDFFP